MENNFDKYFETNKESWNNKVGVHRNSDFYDNEAFLNGKTSLCRLELEELGSVTGKKLLHLQCHFGQDTLSWSRMGAKCTGIDLSNEGIEEAKKLNTELELDANFIVSNVYDVSENVAGKFDIVFTSYGVVGWLPDLDLWATIIADKLNKGGVFYMAEFHPIVWMFDYLSSPMELKYPYLKGEVIYEEYEGTYANNDAKITNKEYTWNHGLSEVVSALVKAGLEIEFLHEHLESPYNCLPNMVETDNNMYLIKEYKNLFPLIYSIKAIKK